MPIKAAQTWEDFNPTYALSALRMKYMEERITEAAEAVTALVAEKPEIASEGNVKVGAAGFARMVVANVTGNGVLKAFRIAHGLDTTAVTVNVQDSEASSLPSEVTLMEKILAINHDEIEIEFETAPAAKETYWLKIEG